MLKKHGYFGFIVGVVLITMLSSKVCYGYKLTGATGFGLPSGLPSSIVSNQLITKWEPSVNTASVVFAGSTTGVTPTAGASLGTPGGATWSTMLAGHDVPFVDVATPDPFHPTSTSSSVIGMTGLPNVGTTPFEKFWIDWALDEWATVSDFTNLGMVTDGDTLVPGVDNGTNWDGNGATNANGGNQGDIRIAGYPMVSTFLADTFQPGTEDLLGFGGNIGGDMHLGNFDLSTFTWVDDASDGHGGPDNLDYDFATVVLHEMGHALGLDHSNVSTSVMATYSTRGGAERSLQPDDKAGIAAIYGFTDTGGPGNEVPVPAPATIYLLGTGLGGIAGFRFREKIRKN
jgi:hypothetical protein